VVDEIFLGLINGFGLSRMHYGRMFIKNAKHKCKIANYEVALSDDVAILRIILLKASFQGQNLKIIEQQLDGVKAGWFNYSFVCVKKSDCFRN